MESTVKANPMDLIPPIPILEIARRERVSGTAIYNAIERLGISMSVTPTGRKTVSPADTVRIVGAIRSRARA